MPPETQPTQGGVQPQQQAQPQQQSLDPSVVALTKSIGKAESGGNYNAGDNTGDGASSSGAYQFTPGFLQEWAPQAGVQYTSGTKLTPAQQDQVAYKAVETMGTTGDPAYPQLGKLTPAQITSAWNTGDPNAYLNPDYGKNNTYGSTENYVNKVSQYYDEYTGNSASTQAQATSQESSSQPDWLTALEGVGLGSAGWIAGQGAGLAKEALPVVGGIAGEAIEPAGGGIVGAAAGEGLASLIPGTSTSSGTSESAEPSQSQSEPDLGSALPESAVASDAVKNAINESLQSTQSGRVFSQSGPGKEAIQTAAQFGLINPDEEGNLTFNEEKLKQAQSEIGNAQDAIIKSNGGTASPVSVANYGGSYIGKDRTATASDRQKASEIMKDELTADSKGIPANGQMSLEDMRTAQKSHYTAAQNAYKKGNYSVTPEMLAHKALGNAYGRTIRDNMKDPELYDKTKKMEQNLINTKQVGKKLNGKKAPKEKGAWESFLRQGARAAEIYIGDRLGGPVGAIVAGFAGEHLNRKIEKKFGRNIFETKGMKAALDILKDSKPKEYKDIVAALKKQGINATDESEVPDSQSGVKKDVQKDEKKLKGLVSLRT